MRAWLQRVGKSIEMRDVAVFGGLALVTVGAGMIYLPAAPLVAGLTLFYLGAFGIPSWR